MGELLGGELGKLRDIEAVVNGDTVGVVGVGAVVRDTVLRVGIGVGVGGRGGVVLGGVWVVAHGDVSGIWGRSSGEVCRGVHGAEIVLHGVKAILKLGLEVCLEDVGVVEIGVGRTWRGDDIGAVAAWIETVEGQGQVD